jgi:hypothetical protein
MLLVLSFHVNSTFVLICWDAFFLLGLNDTFLRLEINYFLYFYGLAKVINVRIGNCHRDMFRLVILSFHVYSIYVLCQD